MVELRDYQRDLIRQTREALAAGSRAPCIVLPCGGGKSVIASEVVRMANRKGTRVLFLIHRQELAEQIREHFRRAEAKADVMMVQTAARRISSIRPPGLIITDESHHSLANSYRKIYDAFPRAVRVGITATPVRLGGRGLGDVYDRLIIGPSAAELIERHYLAPYELYAPTLVSTAGLHIRQGDYIQSEIQARLDRKIYGDVIAYYKRLADGKQAIAYCCGVQAAEDTAEAFRQAGVNAAMICGATPGDHRHKLVEDFRRGKLRILCNADIIGEGFDVPDCAASILLRPTASLGLYIQQSMRCMRFRPGKTAVIIDHVGNAHRHGLPDDPREWTLEDRPKQQREQNTVKIWTCAECYYVGQLPRPARCPRCGAEMKAQPREIEEDKTAELKKLQPQPGRWEIKYLPTLEECRTYQDLLNYAHLRGYKPGWAYYQARQRGWIS